MAETRQEKTLEEYEGDAGEYLALQSKAYLKLSG